MLPDIRAVIAAMVAAAGLLMVAFALVASYRVAPDRHSASLQSDLARSGRDAEPVRSGEQPVLIIETPGPHLAPVTAPVPSAPIETIAAIPAVEREASPVAAAPIELPPAEPPAPPAAVAAHAPHADARALQRAAAEKARKARALRIAGERKAAVRRAAQIRARQNAEAPGYNGFGGTFTGPTGQSRATPRAD